MHSFTGCSLNVHWHGKEGEAIDLPEAQQLEELLRKWRTSKTADVRMEVWKNILAIHAAQVFRIGIVNHNKQPVVVSNRLRNMPDSGVYSFEPGACFGIYMPDTFWFSDLPE